MALIEKGSQGFRVGPPPPSMLYRVKANECIANECMANYDRSQHLHGNSKFLNSRFAWGEAIDEEEDEQARHTKCCITCLGFNDDDKGLTKDEVKTGILKHVEHYISNDDEAISNDDIAQYSPFAFSMLISKRP